MESLVDPLRYVTAALALTLAVVGLLRIRRGGQARRWGAAAFASLAVVLVVSSFERDAAPAWVGKVLICLLLAFPYALLRFTASLGAVDERWVRLSTLAIVAMVGGTVALPSIGSGDHHAPRPAWFGVYAAVVVVYWAGLSILTLTALWREGADQSTLARRRVRCMSAGTAGMAVLILLAAVGIGQGAGQVTVQGLLLLSLAAFGIGFAPPRFLRLSWRLPEQARLREATERLVSADTVSEVVDTLLPHLPAIVGGTGAALYDEHGGLVASTGSIPDVDLPPERSGNGVELLRLSPPFGALVVATSPLTPFFGYEEIGLLRSLGAVADLSLTRCTANERDRESRAAVQEAMEQAKRASTAKSDFLSRMSHELRTPLNVVLGFAQLLDLRGSLNDKDTEAVDQIVKAGRHLLELINEVLDLSRIESGRMAISPEPVELGELAAEALDLIAPIAQERAIRMTGHLECCHCHVTADRQRLKQVLLNLLSNAVKYNRDGGEVHVSCAAAPHGRLRLQVSDTGAGIPAAMMDRLFEPFERLGAETGRVEGTGLGLALSQQLAKLMGGELGVESREGEGSTFWIELAIAEAPHRMPDDDDRLDATADPLQPPRRRILLVEDNVANIKLIEALTAEREHIELLPAMTGGLGLELAREHRPDLVLLDQHLPDLAGAEVLHRLKANVETRDIPVVVVSADATPGQIRRMLDRGAADYLTKPLDVPRFLQVLDGVTSPEEPSA